MANFDEFKKNAKDWMVTSYGDIGIKLGYGGKVTHFLFKSPSLKQTLNTFFVENAVGVELKIGFDVTSILDNLLKNSSKATESATANSNYQNLFCYRSFSRWDIMGALAGGCETEISSICGMKVSGLIAYNNGSYIFSIPAAASPSFGIGGSASAKIGFIIAIDNQITEVYRRQQYDIEMQVRKNPTDFFPRQPGGFAN